MNKSLALVLVAAAASFSAFAADTSGSVTESTDPSRAAQVEEHARALGFNDNVATSGTSSASAPHHSKHKHHKARHTKPADKQGASATGTAPAQGSTPQQ